MPSTRQLANAIRALAMDAVQKANSGHPGMPMGMADVATILFSDYLKFSAEHPHWHDRDRFVLSAGHGSMLLYSLLHLTGYADFPIDELKNFRQLGARTAGHPEFGHGAGVETTTGPLGQGFANAVGMALSERLLAAEFGGALVNHRTWAVVGDGCLMEGISHEAASLAGHLRLAKLNVLFDDNHISIDGSTALAVSDDTLQRFTAYGWHTCTCDGHDEASIRTALDAALQADKPSLIACRTTIGYGAPNKQGTASTHGAPLGEDEVAQAREQLGWTHSPFVIPSDLQDDWRAIGARGAAVYEQWTEAAQAHPHYAEFARRMAGDLPRDWEEQADRWLAEQDLTQTMATRKASQTALAALSAQLPELLGGSADLTGSNLTHVGQSPAVEQLRAEDSSAEDKTAAGGARYLHYGVREHAMSAVMNGIALHGGCIPYGGTFLAFADYCRPAIRLSALMQQRVVYVMTHDSIGLGEDGPTHQPIEHLASLRVIPNLRVWRPCDFGETLHCWRQAVAHASGPSLLALSRQSLPAASTTPQQVTRGAYIVSARGEGARQLTLIGSGSEVALLLQAQEALAESDEGWATAVVSAPCLELFLQQDPAYQRQVLPPAAATLAVEAAHPSPWWALAARLGLRGGVSVMGLDGFGVSAPAADAFAHFNITPAAITAQAKSLLSK